MNKNIDISIQHHDGCVYRIYRDPTNIQSGKRLVCIHGAGVAGQLTFDYIARYLNTYSEILIPDLLGMGDSDDFQLTHPLINDYVESVCSIMTKERWVAFDLCGYSLGGLLAAKIKQWQANYSFKIGRLTLIEPALFDDISLDKTKQFRKGYKQIAETILSGGDAKKGILQFLDLVSPNRTKNPRAENLALRRLGSRSKGFAQALYAVAVESEAVDRGALISTIQPVTIVAGQNSHPGMLDFHTELSHTERQWKFISIPGCDHSLPYQKPRRIAEILEE